MGWKIKIFNILGVHGKIRVSGGGSHEKLIFRGELPKGGLAGKKWVVFLRGGGGGERWYPIAHYEIVIVKVIDILVLRSGKI